MFEEVADQIRVLPLLDRNVCQGLIDAADHLSLWCDAMVDGGPGSGIVVDRRARSAELISEYWLPALFDHVRPAIEARFTKQLSSTASPRFGLSSLQIIRYRPGGHHAVHADSGLDDGRGSTRWRRYSVVCYLNNEFDGGHTRFSGLDMRVKPPPGHCVLFPASYFHAGEPVLAGTKYILTTYLGDPTTMPEDAS